MNTDREHKLEFLITSSIYAVIRTMKTRVKQLPDSLLHHANLFERGKGGSVVGGASNPQKLQPDVEAQDRQVVALRV